MHLPHIPHLDLATLGAGIAALFAMVLRPRKKPAPAATAPEPAAPAPEVWPVIHDGLTARGCMELVGHESIVTEAYKDSKGIWTWGIGVTDASGHKVQRYIDNPQPVEKCLEVFIWLLRTHYLPDVLRAFRGHALSESQLAAALSFHYNTGAILHASWVAVWKAGSTDSRCETSFMDWDKPASIVPRRQKECDLFFSGKWSSDGTAAVLPVRKPSYQPNFRAAMRVNVMPLLEKLL